MTNGRRARHSLIDAQRLSRVFDIIPRAGNVTLEGLTITGGETSTAGAGGGAIRSLSDGLLTVLNSVVSNSASG